MTTLTESALTTYAIDPAHSRLSFIVRHMGFSKVRGSFKRFEGVVRIKPGDLSTLEAEGTVHTDSVTTSDEKRDAHLRSADFFEVEKYPTISFRSTEVRDVKGDSFTVVGDFSLHGVNTQIELQGTFLGEGIDPWGSTRIALEAETRLNRKDYGLNWNAVLESGGFLVSDDVQIALELQAVLQD